MALQISEGALQKTLDRLGVLTNSAFDIGYTRIVDSRIQYDDASFTCSLGCYANASKRRANPTGALYYFIGCNIDKDAISALAAADDRDLLYKYIEYIINYQYLESNGFTLEEISELEELETALGIATLFKLDKTKATDYVAPTDTYDNHDNHDNTGGSSK